MSEPEQAVEIVDRIWKCDECDFEQPAEADATDRDYDSCPECEAGWLELEEV